MAISSEQFVSSPACIPQMTLEQILPIYSRMGFKKFELFSSWCKSAVNIATPAKIYLDLARANGIGFTSMHLPPITDDLENSVKLAVSYAKFAQELGAKVVLYKATTRENYIRGAKPFLDAIEEAGLQIVPAIQNHKGTPVTTLEDFRDVLQGIEDERMKTVLEVGHFQRIGVPWQRGYDLLADSIALVHINEIDLAGESVPYGTGVVDFAGLFEQLSRAEYTGDIVVELELATRDSDIDRTIEHLGKALQYLRVICKGVTV